MKLYDFEVPKQIQNECLASIKRLGNDSIFEFCRNPKLAKYFGGIRPIPANARILREKILSIVSSGQNIGIIFLREASLYQRFTIVLSTEALTHGFDSLEKTFGSAPILLAMLVDERDAIREFAQKKCEQILEWKLAPELQADAQAAFKETFAPFINEISHLLNKPEVREIVREVKAELSPAEAKELSELRKEVKALRKVQSEAYSFANELTQQQEKTARLEREKASILDNDRELRQENKQLKSSIDRLTHENSKLSEKISYLEEKVDAIRQSKHAQQERYETRLKQATKSAFDESYIQETQKLEKERNPAVEFFAQYNKFFNINTKAKLIIDGHNVLNCPINTYYSSLELEHKQKRDLLNQDIGKLLDYLPNLIINLHYDSPVGNSGNGCSNKRFAILYSGGGYREHRADKKIKADYDFSVYDNEIQITFLVTNDQDICNYCKEAIVFRTEDFISFITKL